MALEGGEGSVSRPGRSLPSGKDPVPIVQKAGWAPGQVWTGAENLATTEIRSPDRPARNQSLYRLSYQAHIQVRKVKYKSHNQLYRSKVSSEREEEVVYMLEHYAINP